MRGRDIFKKLKKIIILCSLVFRIFPKFLNVFLYELFSLLPTRVGALLRYLVLKSLVKSIGDNVYIGRHVVIKNYERLTIGSNVSIHEFCYLDAFGDIFIGNNVSIAHRSSLLSFDHQYNEKSIPIKYNNLIPGYINVSDDVWIGAGVVILKNTNIESRVIIAAGAVAFGELKTNHIYGGVPVKIIKEI
ncbi:acyltransferase [Vibrio cholerae]|uniref:acyltransferase n=1 Tax=Vibrio cholerae TaxID=666 RepID=UPI000510D259|nr:acyltransferase [Vibrio cholerae]EGR4429389.1 acyltransferase [Vibrio cholerae]EJL6315009.1 acyltransferase [Vibrio cholerae]MBF8949091.1 acyltransferase [Vibrio cholerae]MBF8956645.1 acyltransferase [Vibrio cholerae]MBF8960132.1 acyltransferase [Vibrio cholerae]